MRLDFQVLWIEDQLRNVQSQKERLEFLIGKEGFKLAVQFSESVEDARVFLADDIFTDSIDLILVDYDFGAKVKGDQGLAEIRQRLPYKEIIFYSANTNNLKPIAAARGVDGIYCTSRVDLPNTAEGVFLTLVKKVLDIDHSRGIVMGATSDIDYVIHDVLLAIFEKASAEEREAMFTLIKKRVEKKRDDLEKEAKVILAAKDLAAVFKKHHTFTSIDRLHLLKSHLSAKEQHASAHSRIQTYEEKVLPIRNDLAHVRVKVDGFSRKLINRDGTELTSDQMKKLRLDLLDHRTSLEELAISLGLNA